LISFLLRNVIKRRLSACQTPIDVREVFESAISIVPKGVRFTQATLGGVPGEWAETEKQARNGTLVYLHGGGYVSMSARLYRPIIISRYAACVAGAKRSFARRSASSGRGDSVPHSPFEAPLRRRFRP
jgi:hypothetical protein